MCGHASRPAAVAGQIAYQDSACAPGCHCSGTRWFLRWHSTSAYTAGVGDICRAQPGSVRRGSGLQSARTGIPQQEPLHCPLRQLINFDPNTRAHIHGLGPQAALRLEAGTCWPRRLCAGRQLQLRAICVTTAGKQTLNGWFRSGELVDRLHPCWWETLQREAAAQLASSALSSAQQCWCVNK